MQAVQVAPGGTFPKKIAEFVQFGFRIPKPAEKLPFDY
jgi:hypothetical protein